ncbi:cyclin-D3-2-like [Primulina huaijiensis]|uniref:cyclin-D3-2-like n=1 Tax=Primulina huaijiensis TaxID=1492673 RepID=UPI003CC6F49B
MTSYQLNPPLSLDSLYCEEEQWDDDGEIIGSKPKSFFAEGEGKSLLEYSDSKPTPFVELLEQNVLREDEELSALLLREQENEPYDGFLENPRLAKDRREAVEWMLRVVGYYSFSALTAVLAVNYLDRFSYSIQSHREKPWMVQLAAVACVSLAAKVEENQVPLLLDIQVESKYVFESKTIQRMEILILSTLEWKMNPVTPHSFLEYFAWRIGFNSNLCKDFLDRCQRLLLSVISDCRFVSYLPSALATATMLYVISSVEPSIGVQYQDKLVSILGTNKEKVEYCCRLIQDVATGVHSLSRNKRKIGYFPESPKGVMDVSLSFESPVNDSWAEAKNPSVSSSPERSSKKIRPNFS